MSDIKQAHEHVAFLQLKAVKAIQIQSMWRMIIPRRKFLIWLAAERYRRHLKKCAIIIQCMFRIYFAQRKHQILLNLKRIKTTKATLFLQAIRQPNTFWYQGIQESMIFHDFEQVISATSNYPRRHLFELNIHKIWKHIHQIETAKSVCIQKHIRGNFDRKLVLDIRQLCIRRKAFQAKQVTTISSFYRMKKQKRIYISTLRRIANDKLLADYLKERMNTRKKQVYLRQKAEVLSLYKSSILQERSSKMLGFLPYNKTKKKLKVSGQFNKLAKQFVDENEYLQNKKDV